MGRTSGAKRLFGALTAAAGLTFATAPAFAAAPLELYYERALMSAANARCGLFTPDIAAALTSAAAQARGAALRGGTAEAALNDTGRRADARAASVSCGSAELASAAGRVRNAFAGWTRTARMNFPGSAADWRADRTAYRSSAWRLVQTGRTDGGAEVRFGVAGEAQRMALAAVVDFGGGGPRPYAARLVFRDASRAPRPWLGAPASRPLPPRTASREVLAQAVAQASPVLAAGETDAVAFRFPADAAAQLAALDPREAFAVEFLFAGDQVRTARFEVGDFAAGQAFLRLGSL